MKTEDFLKSLHRSNILPVTVMEKLEAKLSNTDKHVSPKSITKYLIEKGFLSRYQAKQLLSGEMTPADEIQIQVSRESSQDTDELLRDLRGPAPVPLDATRIAGENFSADDDEIDVVNVDYERTIQQGLSPVIPTGITDPLSGFGFGVETVKESEGVIPATGSFAGKKAKANQWESRWLFIGFALLGLCLIAGLVLVVTLYKTESSAVWESALDEFNKGRYNAALTSMLRFVEDYSSDEKVPDARVKIANCELRVPYDAGQWENTLDGAKRVLPRLEGELAAIGKETMFDDIRSDLSVILPGTALGFTLAAIEAPDVPTKEAQLNLAIEANNLLNESAYVPGSYRKNPGVENVLTEITNNIAIAKRQIQMENDYAKSLTDIGQATAEGKTGEAFEFYFQLTGKYPELSIRSGLRESVAAISKREADLVRSMDSSIVAATVPVSPIVSTIVVGTKSGTESVAGPGDQMLVKLIDGSLFGFRADNGHIVWRKHVGLTTTFHPVWLEEEQNSGEMIAVDGDLNHLMRIDPTTGNEVWRINIGETFADPYVSPARILVTTFSGKVIKVDPETGEAPRAAQLPQTARVSAVPLSDSPLVYQVSEHSNLYVINSETMECREVYYLGHRHGTVSIPPCAISDHLVVAENGADYCKLHVIRPVENGLLLERAQPPFRLDGQVSDPIVKYGRWGLVVTDQGDLRMLEVNKGSEHDPVTVVASKKYASGPLSRKFMLAVEGQLWNASTGLRRFKIQKTAADFKEEVVANSLDTFIAPSSLIGETLFHVRRRNDSSLVSVSAVNATSLVEIWRNDFGAPLAGALPKGDTGLIAVSAQGDIFELDATALAGGIMNAPISRGSSVVQTLIFDRVIPIDDQQLVAVGPAERASLINYDPRRNPASQLSDMQSPCDKPACHPVLFGPNLLVAALRGQVFRIDPLTGRAVGAPFQPELQPNVPVIYREPAVLEDGQTFVIGNADGEFFLVSADADRSLQRIDQISHGAGLVSPMIAVNGRAIGVCRSASDQLVSVSGAGKLVFEKSLNLPGGYVSGPTAIGNGTFLVVVDTGMTVCYDSELNLKWQAEVPSAEFAGAKQVGEPLMVDGGMLLAFESGLLVMLDPESGAVNSSIDLGQGLSGAPVRLGDAYFVPGMDGTLHRIESLSGQ